METIRVTSLRSEYLVNPLGIDELLPRFFWKLESAIQGQKQTAYRIIVANSSESLSKNVGDLWDTGKITSDQSQQIEYHGPILQSYQKCYWKVQVWDKDDKPSLWSESAFWTMGICSPKDWHAQWIGASPQDLTAVQSENPPQIPSPLLRKAFVLKKKIKSAILITSALGEYEVTLNGRTIGDRFLAPEWTCYHTRVQYQTYDLTAQLVAGKNCLGATLADGWYIGYLGPGDKIRHGNYGADRRFLCQLRLEYNDDEIEFVNSDASWKIWEEGPTRYADHFKGETYDASKEIPGWNTTEFNDATWKNVTLDSNIKITLNAQMNEPIQVTQIVKPIAITEPSKGAFIFDLGQNLVGWCKIRFSGKHCLPNTPITVRHSEMLNLDGSFYTENLRRADSIDRYYYFGESQREFHPHFTFHGFRYVEISGFSSDFKPSLDQLEACVIHSNAPIVGTFECSNSKVNRLYQNIVWTHRANILSVPTDCPQRDERMGWMGDAQVFAQTAIYNMDMAAFFTKWSRDLRDDQFPGGAYPDFVPYPTDYDRITKQPSPAWADAGVIVPWRVFENYGDRRLIARHYLSAKRYVDWIKSLYPHLIWNARHNFGDWLNSDTIRSKEVPKSGGAVPKNLFATAYFAYSTRLVAQMASVLGNKTDSEYYSQLADQITQKFNKKFITLFGKMKGNTQAGYALALFFNLIPPNQQEKMFKLLQTAVHKFDDRISTGFCTTPMIMQILTQFGDHDLAMKLFLSERFPSWLYMVNQGATSMWERWDGWVAGRGFASKGMNSFNHYSIGAVGEWIYQKLLGISLDPKSSGFKHFYLTPHPHPSLSQFKGSYDCLYGKISMECVITQNTWQLSFTVPVNTTATLCLPETLQSQVQSQSKGLKFVRIDQKLALFDVESGEYHLSLNIN